MEAESTPPLSRAAVAATVLGFLGFLPICSIAAVVCGHIGLSITRNPEKGRGGYIFAVIGLLLGYIGLVVWALAAAGYAFASF